MILCRRRRPDVLGQDHDRRQGAERRRLLRAHRPRSSLDDASARNSPPLVIFDLNSAKLQPDETVTALKDDPSCASMRTLGFVSHVDTDTIAAARAAGIDQVLARSAFVGAARRHPHERVNHHDRPRRRATRIDAAPSAATRPDRSAGSARPDRALDSSGSVARARRGRSQSIADTIARSSPASAAMLCGRRSGFGATARSTTVVQLLRDVRVGRARARPTRVQRPPRRSASRTGSRRPSRCRTGRRADWPRASSGES